MCRTKRVQASALQRSPLLGDIRFRKRGNCEHRRFIDRFVANDLDAYAGLQSRRLVRFDVVASGSERDAILTFTEPDHRRRLLGIVRDQFDIRWQYVLNASSAIEPRDRYRAEFPCHAGLFCLLVVPTIVKCEICRVIDESDARMANGSMPLGGRSTGFGQNPGRRQKTRRLGIHDPVDLLDARTGH